MQLINKIFNILTIGLLIVFSACSSSEYGGVIPRKAPSARFLLLDGSYIPLEAYSGRVVILSFWGVFCSSSKAKLERLNEMASRVNPQKVVFLAASVDKLDDEAELFSYIKEEPIDNVIHAFSGNEGKDEAFVAFEGEDVPQIFIIDPRGTVVAKDTGSGFVEDYLEENNLFLD
jgi:hypothetical protein